MRKKFILCISLFLSFFFMLSFKVEAKSTLESTQTFYQGNTIGTVTLYDDYTVEVTYSIEVSDIVFFLCPQDDCSETTRMQHNLNQSFSSDEKSIIFYLTDYFEFVNEESYIVTIQAKFLPEVTSINGYPSELECVIDYVEENASENPDGGNNKYEDGIKDSTGKVAKVFRDIIIPFLYAAIVVVLVIKGVLLAMDLVKYSDQPDIRREKIRAFTYFGIALFAAALLNTFAGWYTGLFG